MTSKNNGFQADALDLGDLAALLSGLYDGGHFKTRSDGVGLLVRKIPHLQTVRFILLEESRRLFVKLMTKIGPAYFHYRFSVWHTEGFEIDLEGDAPPGLTEGELRPRFDLELARKRADNCRHASITEVVRDFIPVEWFEEALNEIEKLRKGEA